MTQEEDEPPTEDPDVSTPGAPDLPPADLEERAELELLNQFFEQARSIREGEAVQFGSFVVESVIESDGRQTWKYRVGGGLAVLTRTQYPDGTLEDSVDRNIDGIADRISKSTQSGSIYTRREQIDENLDGLFDSRETLEGELQGDTLQLTVEQHILDSDGQEHWTITQRRDESRIQTEKNIDALRSGCEFNSPPASGPPNTVLSYDGNRITIIKGEGKGACSNETSIMIRKALTYVLKSALGCLENLNPETAALLVAALSSYRIRFICTYTGCTGYGGGAPINADKLGSEGKTIDVSFNEDAIESLDHFSNVLVHEMLHVAGFRHSKLPNNRDDHRDLVYSCGRHCGRCVVDQTIGDESAQDCARCAAPQNKLSCGQEIREEISGSCELDDGGPGTFGCRHPDVYFATPTSCKKLKIHDCAGNYVGDYGSCTLTCPAGYTERQVCTGDDAPSNSCDRPSACGP
ncbi:hypothetical protein [Archangium sp.]|jgi:hypothetical protein|uniref:hypothetical protein n=1 Tax=Archangium sp. TaxID=1872627 RepID=UPI002ED7ECA1